MKPNSRRKPAKEPKKIGRPTKMSPAIAELIIECMALGMSDEKACEAARINRSTLYNWIHSNDPKAKEFLDDIKSGKALKLKYRLQQIEDGAKSWQGIAWLLERDMPTIYSRPEILLELNRPPEQKIEEKHISAINIDVVIEQAANNPAALLELEDVVNQAKALRAKNQQAPA